MYRANVNVNLMVESVIQRIQIKSAIMINVSASVEKKRKHPICKKRLYLESCCCSFENGKYLAIVIDNSVIMFDEIIEEKKQFHFTEKNATCKTKNIYILLAF